MKHTSWANVVFISIFLFSTWAYTSTLAHVSEKSLIQPLDKLPTVIGKYTGTDLELDRKVFDILRTEDLLFREYASDSGETVSLYVSFHGRQTSEAHPHSPRICMPAAGWMKSENKIKKVILNDGQVLNTVKSEYGKGLDSVLFQYWYQTGSRYISNEWYQKFYMIIDGIFKHRTDVAFIRVSTSYDGRDIRNAEKRIDEFIRVLVTELKKILPA